jgi:C-terminal processing protease CtpA/Prc
MRTSVIFLAAAGAVLAPAALAIGAAQFTTPAPMSPDAKAYLDRAIALFREQHINSSRMDWPALTQKAYAAAGGAKTSADTYPAIRLIIKELGEKHTFFIGPDQAKAEMTGTPSGTAMPLPFHPPEAMRLASGIGVVTLHDFMGSPHQGQLYANTGKAEIERLKAQGVCRFVVDLRPDKGGNMYPMISSVGGLLGDGILGTFEDTHKRFTSWVIKGGIATVAPTTDSPARPSTAVSPQLPVAVLIGPSTGSAGEFTAMSFEGRPNTRFFGSASAGYVTANQPAVLSDGAVIVMTGAWGIDRRGKKYLDPIQPDEVTGDGAAAMEAAVKWLSAQPCPRSATPH